MKGILVTPTLIPVRVCPHCRTDLEVEREMFSQDKLFTGHSCRGDLTSNNETGYSGGKMILYNGKAKGLTFKALLYRVFWTLARPIEQLEAVDFNMN